MVGVGLLCIVLCMMSHALFYPAHLLSYCFGLAIAFQIILFSPNLALCMVRAGNFVERGDNMGCGHSVTVLFYEFRRVRLC